MSDTPAERELEKLPKWVIDAVAGAVTPAELGAPGSQSSDVIARVTLATYRAILDQFVPTAFLDKD